MAQSLINTTIPFKQSTDITSQCTVSSGTIQRVIYVQIGKIIALEVQVDHITFSGTNVWLKLPDSFPGNEGIFCPLATAYDGMLCVFRTQTGVSGKYLLIQCSTNGTLNLSASGVCFS